MNRLCQLASLCGEKRSTTNFGAWTMIHSSVDAVHRRRPSCKRLRNHRSQVGVTYHIVRRVSPGTEIIGDTFCSFSPPGHLYCYKLLRAIPTAPRNLNSTCHVVRLRVDYARATVVRAASHTAAEHYNYVPSILLRQLLSTSRHKNFVPRATRDRIRQETRNN